MRVKSWRRAHAAAGRNGKSRLVGLFVCGWVGGRVFPLNAINLLFDQEINQC